MPSHLPKMLKLALAIHIAILGMGSVAFHQLVGHTNCDCGHDHGTLADVSEETNSDHDVCGCEPNSATANSQVEQSVKGKTAGHCLICDFFRQSFQQSLAIEFDSNSELIAACKLADSSFSSTPLLLAFLARGPPLDV